MELLKYNEAYAINEDTALGWIVTGSVLKDQGNALHIDFTANLQDQHVGSVNYNVEEDGAINLNLNYRKENQSEFEAYVTEALAHIFSELNLR